MRKTILLGALAAFICGSLPVWAQSVFVVDRLTDTGEGEGSMGDLRYCITNAVDGDTIVFEVTGTINLTRALPDLTRSISIAGPGPDFLTVQRSTSSDYRIFANRATVSISDLKIAGGYLRNSAGAGIYNSGTLTITNSTISGNHADNEGSGGGVYNSRSGNLFVINSTISGNEAGVFFAGYGTDGLGGGIYNSGTLTMSNSTVSGNIAIGSSAEQCVLSCLGLGGAIYNDGTLTVSNSTLTANQASSLFWFSEGGGIYNTGRLTIGNSTISGNSAGTLSSLGDDGGGIYNGNGGTLLITNSTVSGNRADDFGGGIFQAGSLYMRNTILAGNNARTGPDLSGALTSSGYNLISDTRGGSGFDKTDLLNVNPLLGPLQDNGGPTFTHALLPGSPATDAGDPDFIGPPDFDQRGEGFPRIVNGLDIGAFEVQEK